MRHLKTIYVQVLIGIALGVLVGAVWPDFAVSLKPLGDGFIKLIKLVIAPVIFCTVAGGIAHMSGLKTLGRVGGRALIYFEVVSTFALILGVGAALLISLLSGMTDLPAELEMNRTFGLLPFYVLGLMLTPEHFEMLKRPKARILGAVTLVASFAFVLFVADRREATSWVYWKAGNADMHVNNLVGSGVRIGLLVGATVLVAAFLSLVPAKRTWFTSLGSATLYAYLLHGFATKLMDYMGWFDTPFLHTYAGVATTLACGALLATLLCTPPVRKVMHWALEPDMSWAFVPLRRPRNV